MTVYIALLAVAIFANNGAFLPLVPLGLLGVLGLLVRALSQPGQPVRHAWLYALLLRWLDQAVVDAAAQAPWFEEGTDQCCAG